MEIRLLQGFPPAFERGIGRSMRKKPAHFAYLIAVRQPDGSDHVYAILAQTVDEAVKVAAVQEPEGPVPRHVGSLVVEP